MRRTRFAIALGVPGLAVLAALGTSPQPGLTETSERLPAPGATT
ncbi:MAG: hypothetical protein JWR42_1679, partial [Marmoricola sp.]|nr:hypothetical protein [Marmoricola sp.]